MYTIARFGSSCRSDSDRHSDRDLLIICPTRQKMELLNRYRRKNYSVSFFTRSQLERMQEKGSLFLQHLKIESKIILDSGGEFQKSIDSCSFKPPCRTEIMRCEVALTTVLSWPNDPRTDTWKADWLYCVLRDYLVKRLAAKDTLAFGISDISSFASQKWGLTATQLSCLRELRLNKALFRSASTGKKLESKLFSDVNVLLDTIGFESDPVLIKYPANFGLLDNSLLNTNYQWLRALEGIYILARSDGYIHPSHEILMKLIQQPNLYHSSSEVVHVSVRGYFSDVLQAVTASYAMQPAAIPLRRATLHRAS